MRLWWAAALASMITSACFFGNGGGGSSGVPASLRLPELTAMQRNDLCDYLAGVFPRRTVMCGDTELMLGFQSAAECAADLPTNAECTATVAQTEACIEDLAALTDDEICNLQQFPASCSVIFSDACEGN